ncbi:MAG TPA: hypothetical protein VKD08_14775 [Ignavibacteriaceae bacterium]|nr:hypothetical protein [Ignavibacteriaceae bacterium]
MESEKLNRRKINRKKFFSSLGTGVFGYFVIKSIPFSFLGRNIKDKKVTIAINPDAVRRTKIGEKNV